MEGKADFIEKTEPAEAGTLNQGARTFLGFSFDPIMLLDEQARVLEVNEAFLDLSGGKTRKYKGAALQQFFADDRAIRQHFSALISNEEPTAPFLCTLKRKPAGSIDVIAKLGIFQDENGNTCCMLVLRDVSVERRREEQTSQLAAIVTSSHDAVISTSPDGFIKVWNRSAAVIFGFNEAEAIGQHLSIIIPNELLEEEQEIMQRIRNGEHLSPYDTLRKRKDGRIINVSVVLSPVKDGAGNIKGISKIARETTDQKKFEKELVEARRNAERDKQRAEVAMQAKQHFLTTMSHEIRTPLNAIIGFTRVLMKTTLEEKQKEYLNAIKISGDALIVLINDILDLGKAEAGRMTFEEIPFRPADSVSAMLRLFEPKLLKRNLRLTRAFEPGVPEVVLGDPSRLNQIILNLVGNAVKFTPEGEVNVSVRLAEEDDSHVKVHFVVSDTGIGIAEDDLDAIFENFRQAGPGTARLYGGTGLGLAIVKQLVYNMGGTITVSSTPGRGSVFTVELPFKKTDLEPVNAEEPRDEETAAPGIVRVLVAEDVSLNQLLMKNIIHSFGFECEIAANGKIALEKLRSQKFDLVLMDLHMPEMNGYEATTLIRSELGLHIPVIALTADVTTADAERCRAVGMNDYIPKPVDEKLLYSKIVSYVDKPHAGAEPLPVPEQAMTERVVNLDYIRQHTAGDAAMVRKMLRTFMEETPALINTMKQSINNMDWESLGNAAHAIIPTFRIVGMNAEYEDMARKIKEHATKKEEALLINGLVGKLEDACVIAIKELETELNLF